MLFINWLRSSTVKGRRMTCELLEDPAEVGVIVKTYCFRTFADRYGGVFQHLHSPLNTDLQLIPIGRYAYAGLKHPDKPVFGNVAHLGILLNFNRLIEGEVHMA